MTDGSGVCKSVAVRIELQLPCQSFWLSICDVAMPERQETGDFVVQALANVGALFASKVEGRVSTEVMTPFSSIL